MAKSNTKKTSSQAAAAPIGKQLVLGALVAELLGSAVLAFAALMSGNNPIIAALALLVGILVFTEVSGAHLNPVVSVAAWATKQVTWAKALGYIVVQVLGAMLAYVIVAKFMKSGDATSASSVYTLFTDPKDAASSMSPRSAGEWKPIFGELVGATIFSFGIASAFLGKKVGLDRAFTVGGALLLGLIAAMAGSYAVVNPAVALAMSGFAQGGWWSIAAYGIVPLLGGALGAMLFKLLKQDADASEK
jgi:aquaporin Z